MYIWWLAEIFNLAHVELTVSLGLVEARPKLEHLRTLLHFSVAGSTSQPSFEWVTVESNKLEYGPGTIYANFPSSLGFGVGVRSYSNLLASTVGPDMGVSRNKRLLG